MLEEMTWRYIVTVLALTGILLFVEPCRLRRSKMVCSITPNSDSLESIAAKLNSKGDVKVVHIDIKIPEFFLTNSIRFNSRDSLVINGYPNPATVISCIKLQQDRAHGAGITFSNVTNLTLTNLTVTNCGSLFTLSSKNYSSALRLFRCFQVNISNLVVMKSQGIGLTIAQHKGGNVTIVGSNFTENRIPEKLKGRVYGGGGVYVNIGRFRNYSKYDISLQFENCVFDRNIAHTREYRSFYRNEFGEVRTGYGRGGGVFLAFDNGNKYLMKHKYVRVLFLHCIFSKNQAFLGGGISVHIGRGRHQKLRTKIVLNVKESLFDSNGCDAVNPTRIGGGAHLSYNLYNYFNKTNNEYVFQNVHFTNNCAELGGGAFFISNIWQYISRNVLKFDNCTFERNKAHIGSAIDMNPNIFFRLTTGHTSIVPVFRNCNFTSNEVLINSGPNRIQMISGSGTVYSSLYDIKFEGRNYFECNRGTPVYVVNGIADFSDSSVMFKSNQGIRGGAIALVGLSLMTVGPGREYAFINNEAQYQGGAIYTLMIDTHDFTVSKSCFIQYFEGNRPVVTKVWNNNITFKGNKAPLGPAIFATSLHPCQLFKEGKYYKAVNASNAFSVHGIHIDETEVATEGARLQHNNTKLYAIPGKQYNHGVAIMDDTSNRVDAPLRANMNSDTVRLDPVLSSYVRKNIQFRGKPGERANLSLQTVSARQTYTTFEVDLRKCPPGFQLETDQCVCNANEYFGLIDYCNDFQAYLTPGLWAGLISDDVMVTSICPLSYCDYNKSDMTTTLGVVLPLISSDLDKTICGETRTGILCGSCRPGYTVHFHSPNYLCKQINPTLCKVGWLFYILSELVPVTVVFITVIVFNISFTSGAINGFILFSQVLLSLNIDASTIVTSPKQKVITEGYQLLYGILNLGFFTTETLSFCLWPNATALDMLAFKYITIVYALSLVILVIWFMNKCGGRCLGKCCRITKVKSSVIHGLSAFLIICYSQSILVSHNLVNGVELWPKEGSNATLFKRVWLDGNTIYFSRSHLPYALPALLCLLTIGILPPFLLLAYPLSNKVLTVFGLEESKMVTFISQKLPVISLKPLLDCFQSCFKDNLRFFAGLYFLYRWIAPIVYSTSPNLGIAYIVIEILLIFILAIHALSQPYAKRVHNMVDTILFTDLLLINSISCIHYYLFERGDHKDSVNTIIAQITTVQAVLIYLPFTAMIAYLLLFGCKKIYNYQYTKYGHLGVPLPNTLEKLRTRVHSKLLTDSESDFNKQELDDITYERYVDTA